MNDFCAHVGPVGLAKRGLWCGFAQVSKNRCSADSGPGSSSIATLARSSVTAGKFAPETVAARIRLMINKNVSVYMSLRMLKTGDVQLSGTL